VSASTGPNMSPGQVVVATRVRLARNVDGWCFPGTLGDRGRAEVATLLRRAARRLPVDVGGPFVAYPLDIADPEELSAIAKTRWLPLPEGGLSAGRWLFRDHSGWVSILVNDEDHVRIQAGRDGWCPEGLLERAVPVCDALESEVGFAMDPRWGYLTASPGNLGSGLRVSALMHLPALAWEGRLADWVGAARTLDTAVRGVDGEGSDGVGDFLQVSNAVAFGRTLGAMVDRVAASVDRLVEAEGMARARLASHGRNAVASRFDAWNRQAAEMRALDRRQALEGVSLRRLAGLVGVRAEVPAARFAEAVRGLLADRIGDARGRADWLRAWSAEMDSGACAPPLR